MRELIDKGIVILLLLLAKQEIVTGKNEVVWIYGLLLLALTLSYLNLLGKPGRVIGQGLLGVYVLLVLIYPRFLLAMPVLCYEIWPKKSWWAGIAFLIVYAMGLDNWPFSDQLIILVLSALSVYLSAATDAKNSLTADLKNLRDEKEIQREKLEEQQTKILTEQDRSIYTAQLAERNRIAREIHDNVGHMLTRSLLQVGAMRVIHKDEPVAKELDSLRETLDTAMNNIRESIHDIRDEALDIEQAISTIAEPLKTSFTVSVTIDADTKAIPGNIAYASVSIIKEAVSNITKYSKNDHVDIRFDEHPGMYQIVVQDYCRNGESKEEDRPVDLSGMGLSNIETRVQQLKGQLTITRKNGFRIFVRIPKK